MKVLEQKRKDSYESDSEVESEIKKEPIKHYFSINHQNDALKLISSICDDQTLYNSDEELKELTTSGFLNKSQKIYQNLIRETQVQTKNVEDENLYNLQYDVNHTHKKQTDTSNLINNTNKSADDFSIKEYNQHEASFKVFDKIELLDDNPEPLLHTHDILLNNSQNKSFTKNSLNTSDNLDKEQITNVIYKNEAEISHNTFADNYNVETKNKLNKQEVNKELKDADVLLNNIQSLKTDSTHDITSDADVNTTNEISARTKTINYNKEKLLATMRAIDDNENIEFLNQEYGKYNVTSRKQITENLFRGLPTHTKKKQDIIKDIFDTDGFKNESASSCNKLH